ncbi:MAG: right-handed parallel beta-helix repeat-containing protein [Deltaproteobacteria bacterium]|nr:right-handed parallel beta-helix repeat-containing protein [Deltaproteobacteria bacterium]
MLTVPGSVLGCGSTEAQPSVTATGGGGTGGQGGVGGAGGQGPGGMEWGGCVPGERPLGDGTCLPAGQGAGVPPELCAAGFDSDDQGGCVAILPAAPCPPGQLATPGEATCHELAPCGSGVWGLIPVDTTTEYVDVSSIAGSSDGSETHPWTTLQQGIDGAAPGAIVAVAAGTYTGDLQIAGKAVRLWGRCPAMVTVQGTSGMTAAIFVSGTTGAEIRGLAITGPGTGLAVSNAVALVADQVWVHDTGWIGLDVSGATDLTLNASLVETGTLFGLYAEATSITIDSSSVRDTRPTANLEYGRGIVIISDGSGNRSDATVTASLVERNRDAGMSVIGSTATIEGVVIRDTESQGPPNEETHGRGIEGFTAQSTGERSVVLVRGSSIVNNRQAGVYGIGLDLTVEATVVRDTRPEAADERWGAGFYLVDDPSGAYRSEATIRSCLVTDNHEVGLFVAGSDALVESTILRNTLPSADDAKRGRGISLQDGLAAPDPATLALRTSVLTHNHEGAVTAQGAVIDVESSRLEDTQPQASDGLYGRGITLEHRAGRRAQGTVRWSVVEGNREAAAMVYGSDLVTERTLYADTTAREIDGVGGIGIMLQPLLPVERSTASIQSCLVRDNQRAGIAALGGDLIVQHSLVTGTTPEPGVSEFGDGIVVLTYQGVVATGTITDCQVTANARGGVTTFGALVEIGNNSVFCNAFDLNGENLGEASFGFTDLGTNVCGCDDQWATCKVLSAGLKPPGPLQ